MELAVEDKGAAVLVKLSMDRLDAANADDFKKAMEPVLQRSKQVVLDLGGVEFLDSTGLGSILSCLRKLSAREGKLKLCNVSEQVRLLFQLVRLHRIVEIFANSREALASFPG